MAKITFPPLTAQFASQAWLNARFDELENEFQDKVLYRDNPLGEPNSMQSDIDLSNNDLLNVNQLNAQSLTIGGEELGDAIERAEDAAFNAAASETAAGISETNAATSAFNAATSETNAATSAQEAADSAASIPANYVESIVAGTNVSVDNTDPTNPIVSSTGSTFANQTEVDEGTEAAKAIAPDTLKGNLDARGLWSDAAGGGLIDLDTLLVSGNYSANGYQGDGAALNWPDTGYDSGTPVWFNVTVSGTNIPTRLTQVAHEVFAIGASTRRRTWTRSKHDANWKNWVEYVMVGDVSNPLLMHVRDEKASGVDAGSNIAGVQTRTLNTVVTNEIDGASLSANVITLPAGVFDIEFSAPASKVGSHQAELYNITDVTSAVIGSSEKTDTGANVSTNSVGVGRITITTAKTFRVAHYTSSVNTGDGLGAKASSGFGAEVYTNVKITQIAEA